MTRRVAWPSSLFLAVVLTAAAATGCGEPPDEPFYLPPSGEPLTPGSRTVSTVAEAASPSVPVYGAPGESAPLMTLPSPNEYGVPLVLLAISYRADWLEVLLPVRPNGRRGWVPLSSVRLTQHDYRVRVQLEEHRLTVWRGDEVVVDEPVGVGTPRTPTPTGLFYTTELLKPPRPDGLYGAYAFGLSGYSEVLHRFRGGDGELGIHGTTNPRDLGRDVSHGCVRMSNEAITKLASLLPLGTPVFIGD